MPLTFKALAQRIAIHRAFAEDFRSHLERLWGRALSPEEMAVTRSVTLCDSYMGLEVWERHLAGANTGSEASKLYAQMQLLVAQNGSRVVTAVKADVPAQTSSLPDPSGFPDLLSWEEAIADGLS